jgi:hypothetical protein
MKYHTELSSGLSSESTHFVAIVIEEKTAATKGVSGETR